VTYGGFDRRGIEIRDKKKDGTDEQELWLCASTIVEYIQNDHRPSLDLGPNKMDGGTAQRGHVTARGGPQLPWQRLEADAAFVKQVCDGKRKQLTTNIMRQETL
jgi:hypothetical protein